jgi:V/A-type H+-transporting ATPase subunit K
MDYSMVGPALVLGLGCIGSSIGCGIGGMASHAVMSRVEENHGKFIGMSAVASSQSYIWLCPYDLDEIKYPIW